MLSISHTDPLCLLYLSLYLGPTKKKKKKKKKKKNNNKAAEKEGEADAGDDNLDESWVVVPENPAA